MFDAMAETSAAQGLTHCNQCGACCRFSPCLLDPADFDRIRKVLGESELQFAAHLQVEKTPDQHWQVRMKAPCDFLSGNLCTLQEHKPKGGKDFECWTPSTYRKRYYWPRSEIRALGVRA